VHTRDYKASANDPTDMICAGRQLLLIAGMQQPPQNDCSSKTVAPSDFSTETTHKNETFRGPLKMGSPQSGMEPHRTGRSEAGQCQWGGG
jgi:hypothetical protein